MKKGDIVEGVIEEYSFPNKGSFIHIEKNEQAPGGEIKRKITVKGVLPGQTVRVRIKKKKEGMNEMNEQPNMQRSLCAITSIVVGDVHIRQYLM